MRLNGDVPTQHEQKKKKRAMILTFSLVGALAVLSIVLLIMTIGKMKKQNENSGVVADVTKIPAATGVATVTDAPKENPTKTPAVTLTEAPKATDTPTPEPTKAAATDTPTPEPTKAAATDTPKATPTKSPVATSTPTPVVSRGPVVIIDPGHGGNDGGAQRYKLWDEEKQIYVPTGTKTEDGKVYEAEIVLAIGLKVREMLQDKGVGVLMTRDHDVNPDRARDRVPKMNAEDVDAVVSIHLNAMDYSDHVTSGTEVWYNTAANSESGILANYVIDEVVALTGSKIRGKIDEKAKWPNDGLAIPKCIHPTCLLECEFISSDDVFYKLISDDYQELIATGITNGIMKFLEYKGLVD